MNAKKASQIFARSIKGTLLQSVALAIAFSFTALSVTARADEPRLDGLFLEWSSANLIATDPAGDATGAFDIQNVYATNRGTHLFLRFDISLTKGKDTRVMLLGADKRWILMMEDKFYERDDNTPNKVQQDKILLGEITKEIAEAQNQQIKDARRSEKLQYYFTSLDKIM